MIAIYVGILLVAGSILMLEIALTRVFSVMMWHHMTYMVVSIAMLGFGAAGSILTANRSSLRSDFPARPLAFFSVIYGLSVMLAFCLATRVPISTLEIWKDKWNFFALGLLYLVVSVPFLFGGLTIGLALTRLATYVNRLYFFDLVGSALGGLVSVWLLAELGNTVTVIIAGGIGVMAGAVFALAAGRGIFLATSPALLVAVLACLAFSVGVPALGIPSVEWHVPFAPGKEFGKLPRETQVIRLPSATAEVDIAPARKMVPIMGGNFGYVDRRAVQGRFVGQDGTAPTLLYKNAAHLNEFPFLDDSQAGSAYVAFRVRGGTSPRVLVIGVGGGIDVMIALAQGAEQVTAVEVNRAMVEMVTDKFGDYLGGLFLPSSSSPADQIELIHGEGRSFIRSRDTRYDIIQLSGVDSFTALSTGAYTLSESYLYTTDAIRELYSHLKDGGYINFSRVILTHPRKPRESLRLSNIARTALEELGVEDPTSQIAVFQGFDWASTMVKRGPFTSAEIEALAKFARKQGFWGLVFDPLERPYLKHHPGVPYDVSVRRSFRQAVVRDEIFGSAVDGQHKRYAEALTAAYEKMLEGNEAGANALLAEVLQEVADPERAERIRALVRDAVRAAREKESYFEQTRRDFDSLLRGTARERQAFTDTYQYDVTPATDDAPFFFNYYRYGWLFRKGGQVPTHLYWSDYPVGHVVLLASLLQIVLLAGALILLPLRSLERGGLPTPNRLRIFAYFAALGTGFMFIEIVMMQKMVLFLGHPTYAITVVLVVLLGLAGFGSLLASRIRSISKVAMWRLMFAVVGLILVAVILNDALFKATMGWAFSERLLVVVMFLAPLALALGMPFPLGIRILDQECPQLLPWAWAINGFLSVFSAILCIILAMAIGFTQVLVVAALVYGAGFVLMVTRRPVRAAL
jgi:hypothetical protein